MRFDFLGHEETDSPRPRVVSVAGKIASVEEYEELLEEAFGDPKKQLATDNGEGLDEGGLYIVSESPVEDALLVHKVPISPSGEGIVHVSEEAIIALVALRQKVDVSDATCAQICWTERDAVLSVDTLEQEGVILEHEDQSLLVMDDESLRCSADQVFHNDTSIKK